MTKQEADEIFDSKGDKVFNELLDYIFIERNYEKATKFIMDTVGCDQVIAQAMVLETIPTNTEPPVQNNIPKCPTCQSTNLKKISTTAKATNTIMFGLLGTKRHKSFHCNSCGYEW